MHLEEYRARAAAYDLPFMLTAGDAVLVLLYRAVQVTYSKGAGRKVFRSPSKRTASSRRCCADA